MTFFSKRRIDGLFREYYLPLIKQEERKYKKYKQTSIDKCMRSEVYNNMLDGLAKDEIITRWQADNYSIPKNLL
jgi:hypothetical protein